MWTETPSPIGPLRIVERHGAITAIEFSPYAEGDGRPRGERQDDHPVLAEHGFRNFGFHLRQRFGGGFGFCDDCITYLVSIGHQKGASGFSI